MSALSHVFQMLRLFSRSPAPQLIEKSLLTHCDGSMTVRVFGVPHQACHLQIRVFHSRHKFDAFTAHLPLLHTGFQSYSVGEASPCFRHFLQGTELKELNVNILKKIEGVEK